jgi:hypothetical protein
MRAFSRRSKVLTAIVAISAVVACGGCAGDGATQPPSAGFTAPIGVETQALSGNPWTPSAGGDFNFDHLADVIWYNPVDNRFAIWLMNGTQPLAIGADIAGPAGDGWALASTHDMNFDGMTDVLWYNADKSLIAAWLMNGTRLLAAGPPIAGPAGDGWTVSGVGDFNYDGRRDVLWYNPEKNLLAIWFMNGTELFSPGAPFSGRIVAATMPPGGLPQP